MQRQRTGDQSLVREINLSTVLRWLRDEEPVSRARLAGLTGLNKTTVSSLVDELRDRGLVREMGLHSSGSGRPATLLALNPDAGCIVGVELGVDFVLAIVADFLGTVFWRKEVETDPLESQPAITGRAWALAEEAIEAARVRQVRLLGLGLTLPGMVNVQSGTLVFSPNLQWRNVPLRETFTGRVGVPVYVDNDANAAALGEHLFGVARKAQDFVFLLAGVGLGGGLFLNGDLYRGRGGFAGEVGHMSMATDQSRPCRCGNRGCWETLGNQYSLIERMRARLEVGRNSLVSSLRAQGPGRLSLALILQAADGGDPEAREVLAETGAAIGLGVANLINLLNPEMVVIGGAMSRASSYLLPAINRVVEARALAETRRQTQVLVSAHGPDASVMGAVALVVKAVLSSPSQVDRLNPQPRGMRKEVIESDLLPG